MPRSILKINIANELDVVLAYKRAKQLSEKLGITIANQTKFATAVSEICRNVVEHVGNGTIVFNLPEEHGVKYIEAVVSDRGRGIGNIDYLLKQHKGSSTMKGSGLANSRKLVDFFTIESEFEKGTRVTLRQRLQHNAPPVTKAIAESWTYEFDTDSVSPYAEIKRQNMQLLEVLDQLRERNEVAEQQLQEISRLNEQLQQNNQEIQVLLQEREQQNERLQEINKELDTFAHTVSHDLRAPLQNIDGLARAMQDYLESNRLDDVKELLPLLHKQTTRMDQFIMSILSYSLAGSRNIAKSKVDLLEVLREIKGLLRVPEHVQILFPATTFTLTTEVILLHQVFSNLIGNAIKYHDMQQGATISVSFNIQHDWVLFTVEDNGPGIPDALHTNIFNMYFTVNKATAGTGLGLAIVKKIITGKGGKIWVESKGRGSRFTFTWPAAELTPLV
ncbi:sensor histidine kinase [Pontibacter sp. Tf4]|uniref:sensor histidine kinase n=1 Tax=Pontibacter sp. Tf4 TaxID=2761620 RepID=UPI00162A826B|nr:sensor histidine kinase [Pontibacter sp. Tf4]MBB6610600.1 sensor histidine kinase [Pontibacter sp. Tf4]